MLRVDTTQARPGMSLALPIQNPAAPDQVLLRTGYELNDEIITKLREMRIRAVWVRYPSLDFLEKFVNVETVKNQSKVVTAITDTFEQMQDESTAKLNYNEYTNSITDLIEHLVANPSAAVFLGDIANGDDDLMRHSSAVTYLSLLMGLKLEGYIVRQRPHVNPARAKEVASLGLGAMLHDVGLTLLPEEVREHHRTTGDESDPEYREHTTLGYRMVHGNIDPTAANVVLHHHQRFDGSGWTGEEFVTLNENRIHVFSRIAALADVFDRMRHPFGQPERPTVAVISELLEESMTQQFDPHVIDALLAVVPPYAPGAIVQLSDDRHAVCIDHNPDSPCRPTVQIIPDPNNQNFNADAPPGETLNLSELPEDLYIREVDGVDVTEHNFDASKLQGVGQTVSW